MNYIEVLDSIDAAVWGPPMIILLLGCHIYTTIRTKGIQRKLPLALKLSITKDNGAQGDVSNFGAMATSLASTLGTGSIVGVATAVLSGGPGAVLWMWLTGILGMATKYTEVYAAMKYRVKDRQGHMMGGAMHVWEQRYKRPDGTVPWWAKFMAIWFAVMACLTIFGVGSAVQTSAITSVAQANFGVEPFLKEFLRLTPTPLPRKDSVNGELVDPCSEQFSGFVFKIQANMNKNHRDRIAFLRICSGKFERGMEAFHVQEGKNIKLATGTSLMADDRAIVSEAYAGDIIGLFDPGVFSIGDTLCTGKKHVQFAGIPTFAPEHFARVTQVDTMKRKQFVKGMEQIAQEGAIQIFRDLGSGMEEVVVGVVGVLQLEVLEYRLKNEYNVDIRMQTLPYEHLRWVLNDPDELDIKHLDLTSDTRAIEDMKGNPLLLFGSPWSINWAEQHNPDLKLSEFGNLTF